MLDHNSSIVGSPVRAAFLSLLVLFLPALAPGASPPARGVAPGRFVMAPDGRTTAEAFSVKDALVDQLLAAQLEEEIEVPGWPIAPGVRSDLRLTRHDVYAPDARLYEIRGGKKTEVPRSRWHFFWGEVQSMPGGRALLIVDPDDRTIRGQSDAPGGLCELRAPSSDRPHENLVAPIESFFPPGALSNGNPIWTCGQESLPPIAPPFEIHSPDSGASTGVAPEAIQWLHLATIAVDTDNELMSLKFADNVANATNYVAQLFAAITVGYERDLKVRLLQGNTTYRVSTTTDPYTGGTTSADQTKLQEFSTYWSTNYGSVTRALAMMLSGKQASTNSSSGIAWINSLCNTSYGYSFTQVFKFGGATGSSDALVVGHEVGHNFGSPHTHCYSPPIDNCYNTEAGCYAGTKTCPASATINGVPNVTGTWMSYCHLSGIAGCTSSQVFHPTTVTLLNGYVQSKVGVCIFPSGTPVEASPGSQMRLQKAGGVSTQLPVTFSPSCGATRHTVYTGSIANLASAGVSWTARYCLFDNSGNLTFDPAAATNFYFVVAGNNGTQEGSYGHNSSGAELPAAPVGGGCNYTRVLGGVCP